MQLASFVLVEDPPQVAANGCDIAAGQLSDGVFIVDELPATATFGALVELGLVPQEGGEFDIRLMISHIRLVGVDRPGGLIDLDRRLVRFPPASDSWSTDRTVWAPFELELTVPVEVDVLLWVEVNGEPLAYRPLIFRSASQLPPTV